MDVEKSVYICTERLRGIDNCSIIILTFNIIKMEKKEKIMSVEDSFDSSDCSVFESNFANWYGEEKNRLSLKGYDTSKFFVYADPDINEGIIICADYTMKFNRDECVIDLVINGALNSPIWDDVIENVPVQFASFLDCNSNFLFHFSTNIGDEMGFYVFAFWANGRPVFAMVSDELSAPIFERCFYR